ncbi:metal-sensing transcriptional repressor [Phaeovulum sp. NW3]|uniref:metal-sensing transcriptional repressor n=1 Tax=Phaeovulum sp. NW3 TaxID=2934933 RepID=UPI0020226589|nr:metal-sensing transcriptional repressor [Phaeovulum sp. NW3]MCL7466305.1 metal-sensing transcriptional repressor [Phaeovulum sp. NW3]
MFARLKRADRYLRPVIDMNEAVEPCLAITHQLCAKEKALLNVRRALIRDHIDHGLNTVHAPVGRAKVKTLVRYR